MEQHERVWLSLTSLESTDGNSGCRRRDRPRPPWRSWSTPASVHRTIIAATSAYEIRASRAYPPAEPRFRGRSPVRPEGTHLDAAAATPTAGQADLFRRGAGGRDDRVRVRHWLAVVRMGLVERGSGRSPRCFGTRNNVRSAVIVIQPALATLPHKQA